MRFMLPSRQHQSSEWVQCVSVNNQSQGDTHAPPKLVATASRSGRHHHSDVISSTEAPICQSFASTAQLTTSYYLQSDSLRLCHKFKLSPATASSFLNLIGLILCSNCYYYTCLTASFTGQAG